jgi:hypothetical protein
VSPRNRCASWALALGLGFAYPFRWVVMYKTGVFPTSEANQLEILATLATSWTFAAYLWLRSRP